MKLTILVDNNTLINRYFLAEPAVSYFIEDGDFKCLFDVGFSDVFLQNAEKLDINVVSADAVVLTHGHLDHTWGLSALLKKYLVSDLENQDFKKPEFVVHERTFYKRPRKYVGGSHSLVSKERLTKFGRVRTIDKPYWLTDCLVSLPNIPRQNNFENKKPVGHISVDDKKEDDYMLDEISLAYKSGQGLVVITGCGHAGICNTIEYAKEVCNEDRIAGVIGGFHLLNPPTNQLKNTVEYFEKLKANEVYACHCVDLPSKVALSKVANIKQVGSGLQIEFD